MQLRDDQRRPDEGEARLLKLPPRAAFALLAFTGTSFLAGTNSPTPLYARYQAAWGLSPITTTVVFGIYSVAVLSALLTVGSLSDFVGRRPVILGSLVFQSVSMLMLAGASGVGVLLAARVLQGLCTGAALSAIGAGMIDLERVKGTIANSVCPMAGTGLGGFIAGFFVEYLPAPTRLIYLTILGLYVLQAMGIFFMAETVTPRPGALASLRPQMRVPAPLRAGVLLAAPLLVSSWALMGFYGALGAPIVRLLTGTTSPTLAAAGMSTMACAGAITVLLLRASSGRTMMITGASALPVGTCVSLLGLARGSALLFFVGTALAGVGFGTAFQGAIRTVVPFAHPHERAGVIAVLFVVAYLALGVPAIFAGIHIAGGSSVATTANEYGAVVIALSLVALVGTLLSRRAPLPVS